MEIYSCKDKFSHDKNKRNRLGDMEDKLGLFMDLKSEIWDEIQYVAK